MFVYIHARLRCGLIGGNLTAQSAGNHRGIGGVIQIPEKQWQAVTVGTWCKHHIVVPR